MANVRKNKTRYLNIKGALLDKNQLASYLEKIASEHNIQMKSSKDTYPIPRLNENFLVIKEVYKILNENIKLGIPIHPAGEWILDNLYVIEEIVKNISKDLTLKKYTNFVGIANGRYQGFARIYVLACEMVAYTDAKIDNKNLEEMLTSYQNKKTLSMEEIWNIGSFIQIALIENIREICESIYYTQMQKYKVENTVSRFLEDEKIKKENNINMQISKLGMAKSNKLKNAYVEYMSYKLKKYGKQGLAYLNILGEEVAKTGNDIAEIVRKEHFDIAIKKVAIGNDITSLKTISRINFLEIFEKINGVEDILKQDPARQYDKMDCNTKIYYRNAIQEISTKLKVSEIYIAKKCLNLCLEAAQKEEGCSNKKRMHVGYYLISDGKQQLYESLLNRKVKIMTNKEKTRIYIFTVWALVFIFSLLISICVVKNMQSSYTAKVIMGIIWFILLAIPLENIVNKTIQYVLSKIVKPKLIPKLDFQTGIPEEYSTMVVIPTIVKNKEKVKELMEKLEVFYMANKTENLYFTLLGDCSSSDKEEESFDEEIISEGIKEANELNKKYPDEKFPKFNFIYRKRVWNESEGYYLGWERKRGLLNQFNEYLLGNIKNPFRINTIDKINKNIKYVITLDADTDLSLNSGLELVGAMAHILNDAQMNENKDLVISGFGIIAPRVGVSLLESRKTLFTQIYAGQGGTDSYTSAVSDMYQDNFDEGIYTGKGIYNLEVFSKVLNNEIRENTVLSHDLLEGNYLRCGSSSDIMLMDGYPTTYLSSKLRTSRWIRGDYQILPWLKNKIVNRNNQEKTNPLNTLSKYKIFSNIIRSKQEICALLLIICGLIFRKIFNINVVALFTVAIASITIPTILDLINTIICKKENCIRTKTFTKTIKGLKASFIRAVLDISTLPDKAYMCLKSEVKTMYRMLKSKKHMLEWMTSEEAEKNAKTDIISYYQNMSSCLIFSALGLIFSFASIANKEISMATFTLILSILWLFAPMVMYKISKKIPEEKSINLLNEGEKQYLKNIGYNTWQYFKENLNEKGNFLPPDNYQEDRKPKLIMRTSPTNIGLALLAVVSSYDLHYESLEDTIDLLEKMINTISNLQKWNGHLYNWYNIENLEPLIPKYVSSVDSGNFVGYLYVLKQFLQDLKNKTESNTCLNNKIIGILLITDNLIENTDFSKLYDEKNRLFSVGFNVEENKLTDSYYDLLASEARQTSLVAIAKKDISPKHWNNLSRTLTILNNYKGLISWSGTAFEYLMPNINIPQYPASILDESCKFMIMSQIEYAKRLGIPWGISEAAFNLKDLNNNYQYKAFGIPWLGLKRGLADEMVASSYGTMLAVSIAPKEVVQNLKRLEQDGMNEKYGFYESIDFTPGRNNKKYALVKTYMAHHQGLILLSINNLFNNNIIQKRFMENPEMQAVKILLEEKMPDNMIITKEEKEKVEKIKYVDYEDYTQRKYEKINENLNIANVISNEKYTVVLDQYGDGFSKYKNIQINRYKQTDDEKQGIMFYLKDIKTKKIWTNSYSKNLDKPYKYNVTFSPDMDKITRCDDNIETTTKIITDTDDAVEIRRLELKNLGLSENVIEVTSYFEPILSSAMQDYSHKAFNNLFIRYDYVDGLNTLIVKRKAHTTEEQDMYMAVSLNTSANTIGEIEYEIDKERFMGRGNIGIPKAIQKSIPFSRNVSYTTDPIVAMKRTISIKPEETVYIDLIISVSEEKESALKNLSRFISNENIIKTFELSKARSEAETRYLGIKGKDIENYQKMLSYLLFTPKISILNPKIIHSIEKNQDVKYETQMLWKYGISGDIPILLVKIDDINDIDMIQEVLNAYEFFRAKNIQIDLVILNEEKGAYENYVKDAILSAILNKNLAYLLNINGGIFCLNNIENKQEKRLLEVRANLVIHANYSSLEMQMKDIESQILESVKETGYDSKKEYIYAGNDKDNEELIEVNENTLKYYNEYGGFSKDGKEYIIKVNKNNKLPTQWSNILANENFGTVVTESMGGYTWYKNSKLNRITAWNNNQVTDIPSEIIYLKDMQTDKKWSLGLNPMPDENDYYIVYGLGYAKYLHSSSKIRQNLEIFVAKDENVKINILHLENKKPEKRNLRLVYYIKPVLGEDEIKTNGKIYLDYNYKSNMILANNITNQADEKIFISSSEKIESYTGSKLSFLKGKTLEDPAGLDQIELNRENSLGKDGIIAISLNITLDAWASKDITIMLGECKTKEEGQELAYKYSNINNAIDELNNVKKYWKDIVERLQVKTPVESTNILLNSWLIYQVLASRLYGRTGYYQSGGAYGFRDQLQDVMAIKYVDAQITRNQILKHSKHQFIEGDVEHWWHEETSRGIRTKFSDDLLWLAYVTADYIEFTNDYSILDEQTSYKTGNILQENETEKYDLYLDSNIKEDLYSHCIRAINKSLNFGEHGLPKMGSGDWNDGFNNVGPKGIGESVWLGFFLYDVLNKFIPICEHKNDEENALKYKDIMIRLKKALNTAGWDNRWYKRAYTDSGEILGSLQNEECRIDSISQSWSVISGAGDNDKKYISMESLENHLVNREIGIIKLLDPPFEKSKLEPGYIKAYLPGTRENGGQYTHECCC